MEVLLHRNLEVIVWKMFFKAKDKKQRLKQSLVNHKLFSLCCRPKVQSFGQNGSAREEKEH